MDRLTNHRIPHHDESGRRPLESPRVAVVIPCFRVTGQILDVIRRIGPEVERIIVVDDCCPENSGDLVQRECEDERVCVVRHTENQGVGGAVMSGYRKAIEEGGDIAVKVDGDGQMDPALIPRFIAPIVAGKADYTKGNRFYDLTHLSRMPGIRLFGNATLSFMAKLSSGYWNIFDPTNGYTAIHTKVAARIPFESVSKRYFFETDLLFRLNTIRAVVQDIPMDAVYGEEQSNLHIRKIVGEFLAKHARNLGKRIFYNYFLRDMTITSIELVAGCALAGFGLLFGAVTWINAVEQGHMTPLGTIMLAALPFLIGLQFILAFLNYDISSVPRQPIHTLLP